MIKHLLCIVVLLCASLIGTAQSQSKFELPAVLKIGISADSYPYMFLDPKGQPSGLVVDYWRELAKQQRVKVEFVSADWADTLKLLDNGDIDLHGGLGYTKDRAQYYLFGKSYLDIFNNVFVHRDLSGVHNLADLRPHLIGVVARSTHIDSLQQLQPDLILKQYSSVTQMYDSALRGEIKAFTGLDRLPPRYASYRELTSFYPVYKKVPIQKIELTYAVKKGQVGLYQALADATSTMAPGFLDQLERKWLSVDTDPNTLLIGVSLGNQPYMHVSSIGDVQGLFVDLWRLWSKKTGIAVSFVPDQSENSLEYLRKSRIDVQMAQTEHPDKFEGLRKAYHLYNVTSAFFYQKELQLTDLSQVTDQAVGVLQTAYYKREIEQQYPGVQLKVFDTIEEMIEATQNKQLAGFFASEVITQKRLLEINSQDSFKKLQSASYELPVYSLIRPDDEDLYQKIQQGFSQITLDEMIEIEQRWLNAKADGYFYAFREKVPLTAAEQEWLKVHPQIQVGMMNNWPPVEFVNEYGEAIGISADVLKLLNKRLGSNFVARPYSDWDALLNDYQQGKLQMVANISDLPQRRAYNKVSLDFWSLQWVLIGKPETDLGTAIALMPPKRIAMMRDYQFLKQLKKDYPQHKVIEVSTLEDGLEMVVAGQADFVLDTVVTSGVALRDPRYINLRLHLPTDLPVYPSYFGVRADLPELLAIVNKGLKTINDADRKILLDTWLNVEIKQGLDQGRVSILVMQIAGLSAVVLLGFLLWNFSLRREVTLRRKVEEKMRFMAGHDDLTQLPNRSLFLERLQTALYQHARHNEMLALMFIDLDGFKQVNDQYGHDAGDEMLVKLAAIFGHCVRKTDTVARFGGDEFVILLTGLVDKDDAAIVAEKILLYLQEPLSLSVCQALVGASIGIAIYPHDGTDAATLLKSADKLMYQVKQQGKRQYRFSR